MAECSNAVKEILKQGIYELMIHGKVISEEEIYQLSCIAGEKRKFKDVHKYRISQMDSNCLLPILEDPLKQWQTIAYYSIVFGKRLEGYSDFMYFIDLDLLVTKDYSMIDDMHYSVALMQTPDLPYCHVERIELKVLPDGSYDLNIENIVDFVREKLLLGYYVAIELDDYFIKEETRHSVLRSFVYGFNDDEEEFYCLGFMKRIFQKFKVKYSSFVKGYEYGKLLNLQAPVYMELYKMKNCISHEYDSQEFLKKRIKAYFESSNNYDLLQGESKEGRWQNCYEYVGFQASCMFVNLLERMCVDHRIQLCYQCMHAFFEQKKRLYVSIKQLEKIKGINILEECYQKANAARLFFLKCNMTNKKENLLKCVKYCKEVVECEKTFLNENEAYFMEERHENVFGGIS